MRHIMNQTIKLIGWTNLEGKESYEKEDETDAR